MKKFYFIILMLVGAIMLQQQAYAQIVGWQFTAPAVNGNEATAPPTLVANGLTVTNLSRGAGWAASPSTLVRSFVSNRVGTATDTTAMVAQDMYFGFNITINANFKASLSYLTYRIRLSSSAGAKLWYWKYSLNGTGFNKLNEPVVIDPANPPITEGVDQPTTNLSGVSQLQNLPAGTVIYIRLYAGNSGTGSTAIGRSATSTTTDYALSVGGSVENVTTPPILAWQFASPVSNGNEASINASLNNVNLNTATLVRGAGLNTTTIYSRSFSAGANVTSTNVLADTAIAVANDMYFGYTVNAKAGHTVSLSKLNYKVRRSGGGAQTWYWKYSIDNVIWNKLAEPYQLVEQNNLGVNAPEIDLSAFPKLQNVGTGTTVYLRLYLSGSNNTTGSSNIGQSDLNSTNSYVLALDGTIGTTLPIKLTSFTGKAIGSQVKLDWTTATETNNLRFEVLGVKENSSTLLGAVAGSGTTTTAKKYTFTDKNPISGTNYYQLRQIDGDGTTTVYPEIVAVRIGLSKSDFTAAFTDGNLGISLNTDKAEKVKITLTDMLGKVIATSNETTQEGLSSFTIPTNAKEGIYIVTIINSNQERVSKKIIK